MRRQLAILIILGFATIVASGQSDSAGRTPFPLSPGTPAGSYILSDFDSVNLYGGGLSIHLPLREIAGRGDARYTMYLVMDRRFSVDNQTDGGGGWTHTAITNNLPGKTFYMEHLTPPAYSPGFLVSRSIVQGSQSCEANNLIYATQSLTRLTFLAGDGTETELIDTLHGGTLLGVNPCVEEGAGPSRGRNFSSRDGSSVSFISDTEIRDFPLNNVSGTGTPSSIMDYPTGWLLFKNGVKYHITGGLVDTIKDRNGNRLNFLYSGNGLTGYELTSVTDSLGRVTTVHTDQDTFHTIVFNGADGSDRIIRLDFDNLEHVCSPGPSSCTLQSFGALFGLGQVGNFGAMVVKSVTIPGGRQYLFTYNTYAEVTRIDLPTGGALSYTHGAGYGTSSSICDGTGNTCHIYRRVISRDVSHDGTTVDEHTTYTSDVESGVLKVTVGHSDGAKDEHYFFNGPQDPSNWDSLYSIQLEGKENQTELYDTNGTALLRKVENTWAGRTCEVGEICMTGPVDPRLTKEATTIKTLTSSAKTYGYDRYNNQTDVCEFAFGQSPVDCPAPSNTAGLIRRTSVVYKTTSDDPGKSDYDVLGTEEYNTSHIRNLVASQSVYARSGSLVAQTTNTYDNAGYFTPNSTACAFYDEPGTRPSGGTGLYPNRGNLTGVTRQKVTPSGAITSYLYYDQTGNVVKAKDANGNSMSYSYADSFSVGVPASGPTCAFVTTATAPITTHVETLQYNLHLGKPTQRSTVIAPSGGGSPLVATLSYQPPSTCSQVAGSLTIDPLDRLGKIVMASGDSAAQSETKFCYDNTTNANKVTALSDLTGIDDHTLRAVSIFDGLGRAVEKRQFEGPGAGDYIATKTDYDGRGRAANSSNPYRPASSDSNENARQDTTYVYDGLGRATTVTAPGGAATITLFETVTAMTSFDSTPVVISQVTDPAGAVTKTGMDAAARLSQVIQHPVDIDQTTNYQYDVLDNLTDVNQSGMLRSFIYDGLSRLTSATNPESGTNSYTYDANGNVLTVQNARGTKCNGTLAGSVCTTGYDALNRLTVKTYSDPGTKDVHYVWDTIRLGSLSSVYNADSSTTYDAYDALGRVTQSTQHTAGVDYPSFHYQYYRNSSLSQMTYPSGRIVSYTPDDAGRIKDVSGTMGDVSTDYAKVPYDPSQPYNPITNAYGYAAHGAIRRLQYFGKVEQTCYNNRMQPTDTRLGSAFGADCTPASGDLLDLSYSYGTSPSVNNGNVAGQSIIRPGSGQSWTQTYGYDHVNRLTSVSEGANWAQTYIYDITGNRAVAGYIPNPDGTPTSLSDFTNNQWRRGAGDDYDTSGNMKQIAKHDTPNTPSSTFTYDLENRMITSTVPGGTGPVNYVYDGDGRRVMKTGASNTVFVYDAGGQLAAEYGEPGISGTQYLTPDHLGSTRLVASSDGSLNSYDFMPFGEELQQSVGGRDASHPAGSPLYPTSANLQSLKFTGKERDAETGLDYFIARYDSSAQGRFMSPDPTMASAHLSNPQSWNRYSYVMNNPLALVDPDGMLWTSTGDKNDPYKWVDDCADGQTCYDKVAAALNSGVFIYGATQTDVTRYAANKQGLVDITELEKNPASNFESIQTPGREENFLGKRQAAALFNVAAAYEDAYPTDAALVFTGGSTAGGGSALKPNGDPIHQSHRNGANIDLAYMGANGRPLSGPSAAASGDVDRNNFIIDQFALQGANLGSVVTGQPRRYGLGPIRAGLQNIHKTHMHFQSNYPLLPRP